MVAREKSVVLLVSAILLLALARGVHSLENTSLSYPDRYFSISNSTYYAGNEVSIQNITNISNAKIIVIFKDSQFSYPIASDAIIFLPSLEGKYEIKYILGNESLQNKSIEVISANEPSIYTDKKEYFIGDTIKIFHRNFETNDSILIKNELSTYNLREIAKNPIEFNAASVGDYEILAQKNSKNLNVTFSVLPFVQSRGTFSISTLKKTYNLSETVIVNLNFTKKSSYVFYIYSNESIYTFLGPLEDTLSFVPRREGNYILRLQEGDNVLASYSFDVEENSTKINEYEYINQSTPVFFTHERAAVEFDLREIAKSKRSIINILFGTSPIETVTFYVDRHQNDYDFNLSAEIIEDDFYRVHVSNTNANSSEYKVIADVTINGERFIAEKKFEFIASTHQKTIINKTDREKILEYVNHTFEKNESARIIIDFTPSTLAALDPINLALKKTTLSTISAFVEGHENDANMNVDIRHIEFDRFEIVVTQESHRQGIYKIVAIATNDEKALVAEIPFNWGISDFDTFIDAYESYDSQILDSKSKSSPAAISTDKPSYFLGENVSILVNERISTLDIFLGDSKIESLPIEEGSRPKTNFSFLPKKEKCMIQ